MRSKQNSYQIKLERFDFNNLHAVLEIHSGFGLQNWFEAHLELLAALL